MAAAAAALLLLTIGASAAEAGWTRASTLAGTRAYAGPVVATNHRGDVLMAWYGAHGMEFAEAHRGGRFGRAHRIARSEVKVLPGTISLALDERGAAVVAWEDCRGDQGPPFEDQCYGQIRASARPAGGRFRPGTLVAPGDQDVYYPRAAVDGGHATVTWGDYDGIYAARTDARWRFRPMRRVSRRRGGAPAVTIWPSGDERFLFAVNDGIATLLRPAGHRPRPAHLISRSNVYEDLRVVAGSPSRREQGVAWDTELPNSLKVGVTVGGRRIRQRTLARGRSIFTDYEIAGAPSGDFLAGFTEGILDEKARYALRYSRRLPGRGFTAARRIRGAKTASAPAIGVDSSGLAIVGWITESGREVRVTVLDRAGRARHRARFRMARTSEPSCDRKSDFCDLPEATFDGLGHGYLVWPDDWRVRVARYRP